MTGYNGAHSRAAWTVYKAKQAQADAAREISTDVSTDAGEHAWILSHEAEAAYDEYVSAWVRENYTEAELAEIEAQNRAEAEM